MFYIENEQVKYHEFIVKAKKEDGNSFHPITSAVLLRQPESDDTNFGTMKINTTFNYLFIHYQTFDKVASYQFCDFKSFYSETEGCLPIPEKKYSVDPELKAYYSCN